MIALVVSGQDYHFYMQNSNNTWSHKPGEGVATNGCLGYFYAQQNENTQSYGNRLCSNQVSVLTNSNLLTHLHEGYETDYIFFYVDKPATLDYAHLNGLGETCSQTSLYLWDLAGSTEETAAYKYNPSSFSGRIDYKGDIDYFAVNFPTTGTYTLSISTTSVSPTPDPYPLKVTVYGANGTSSTTANITGGSGTITLNAYAGRVYYIKVELPNQTAYEFGRRYSFSVSKA